MDSSPINNMTINLSHVAEEEEEEASSKFKKLISTLPKEKGSNDFMDLYQYQGFWYPFPMLQAIISAQENFKSSWNDIYICSAPKTGCTWLKALCYAIVTRDHFNMENNPLLTNLSHVLIPSLEFDSPKHSSDMKAQNIPLIATHIPFDALPKSVQSLDGTKMIYLCREPKDTFISLWHFMQRFTWLQQGESDETTELLISFEEGFKLFCEGKTMWGPYWIMFWGTERIVKLCSFDNLSNLEVIKNGQDRPISSLQIDNSAYFRKGKPLDT